LKNNKLSHTKTMHQIVVDIISYQQFEIQFNLYVMSTVLIVLVRNSTQDISWVS
jgi:hypothetical protein